MKLIFFHSFNKGWVFGIILFAITLFVYHPAWNGQPIWDDDAHITRPELRSLNGLTRIWTELGATQQYYPLVHTVYWLEHRLWGDKTLGYHLLNIILHIFSALLLVRILQFFTIPGAWLIGAIFALHPVQVESVAWITELKNTLSGVFFLSTALVYLKFDGERRRSHYTAALCFFILGLLSKSVIATLPVSLLVVFWWKRGKIEWKRDVVPLLPFFVLGITSGLFTAYVERKFIGAEGGEFNFTFIERYLIAGRAVWFYLSKLFWPVDLIFIYPRWNINQAILWQYLFPVGALILLAILWILRKRSRAPLATFLFFSTMLFPVLGFFNVYPFRFSFVADHFQYLACIGPITIAVSGINKVFESLRGDNWYLKPAVSTTLLLLLSILTWRQCGDYSNAETMYRNTIKKNPICWMAYNNFGLLLANIGRTEEAFTYYQKALEIKPNYYKTHINIGILLAKTGRMDEAIAHYHRATEINPNAITAYNNLGNSLAQNGRTEEAIEYYRKALGINPKYWEAHYNIGLLYAKTGRFDEAMAHYRKALEANPDYAEAQNNLGNVLLRIGRIEEAIAHYQKALDINPNYGDAHFNIGNALFQTRQTAEAIAHFQKALELNPNNLGIIRSLAFALLQQGQLADAIPLVERALALAKSTGNESLAKEISVNLEKLYELNRSFQKSPR